MSGQTELLVPVRQSNESSGALDSSGIITTWSPNGEAHIESIRKVFEAAGLGHIAPRGRTLKEAARAALVEKFSKKNRRVAPAGKGYELLLEIPKESEVRLDTHHVISLWIEVRGGEEVVVSDVQSFEVDGITHSLSDVSAWIEAARHRVDGGAIGESLAGAAAALRGIAIRDSGGAYWLPPTSTGRWTQLVDGLNSAGRPMRMRIWDAANSPRSIESTIDSIQSLVDKRCDEILTAVEGGELGVRALDTKGAEVVELAKQLEEYEKVLNVGLDSLRQRVLAVQSVAVQAHMSAIAESENKLRDRRMAKAQQEADANA